MNLYGIKKELESPIVTLRKAHNKFIFDTNWNDDLEKLKEDHYEKMALIVNFTGK